MKKTLLAFVLALVTAAASAAYPEKPITLVVPFPAGGPTDKTARDFAEALRQHLGGVAVVIENKGGAGGTIGATAVARASSDGYTLLLHHIGMATAPSLYRSALPYRPLDDFEYLGLIEEVPMTLIGRKSLAAKNYQELVAWVAEKKGGASLGNSGIGSASHLCGLMLMSGAKLDMVTVPYKGTGPAMTDLVGGQIDLLCDQTTNTTAQIASDKVNAYAVTTKRRLGTEALKRMPTLDELGLENFDIAIWVGLYAPKGTPAALKQTLNQALRKALRDPTFIAKQEAAGATIVSDDRMTPEGHRKFVASEIDKWGAVIRAAGQYAD